MTHTIDTKEGRDALRRLCEKDQKNWPAKDWPMENETEFIAAARVALPAALDRIEKLEAALKQIAENKIQECFKCEGSGLFWADGKAHLPLYKGATMSCPMCEGKGHVVILSKKEMQEIAINALMKETG